jgi:allophanate hydrolase
VTRDETTDRTPDRTPDEAADEANETGPHPGSHAGARPGPHSGARPGSHNGAGPGPRPGPHPTVAERVAAAYRRIAEVDRPEVWITLREEADVLAQARALDERPASADALPLAGLLLAVKDNIDVAGLPTTAAHPGFARVPEVSAPVVARLVAAGALVLGKTNMDQFATGLVGTRSPYGAVRAAGHPEKVSGGSSSGSAVTVALGIADLALGTDTAGSGRVPAAFNGIVGLKPTLGLVPNTGTVHAARPFDTVTVFARTLATAQRALAVMTGPDAGDPRSRTWPDTVRLAAPPAPRVAVPRDADLAPLSPAYRAAFDTAVKQFQAAGVRTETVDVSPLLAAARLLYDGALVAERYAAVGEFVAAHRDGEGTDPTVAGIILASAALPAHALAADQRRLDAYRTRAVGILSGYDALLLPTTTEHPDIAAVRAEPVVINARLGTYTNFVNLLDLCAVAVPAGEADGGPFGVTLVARAFEDQVAVDLAARLTGDGPPAPYPFPACELAVFGAHMTGQPLNGQLVELGARYAGEVVTAAEYRLYALPTVPPKPGLVDLGPEVSPEVSPAAGRGTRKEVDGEVGADGTAGVAVRGERWRLSPAALGRFLAALEEPLTLGRVRLADGGACVGFLCGEQAARGAVDISGFGGWRAYLGEE